VKTQSKLVGGPYKAPRFKVGRELACVIRGDLRVTSISGAPIPWPCGRSESAVTASLIVCGDLAKALEVESSVAIQEHWGVSKATVRRWRAALEIDSFATEGHMRAKSEFGKTVLASHAAEGGLATKGLSKNQGEANGRSSAKRGA
jgi:hypothetical protein